jgi:hypothetical protein
LRVEPVRCSSIQSGRHAGKKKKKKKKKKANVAMMWRRHPQAGQPGGPEARMLFQG